MARKPKKFDEVSMVALDGTRYLLKVMAYAKYDVYDAFYIEFPWGTEVVADNVDALLKLAREEVKVNGMAKKERIIGIDCHTWGMSLSSMDQQDEDHSGSLGLQWLTGYRARLSTDRVAYYDDNGKINYDLDRMTIIPWSQAREDALRNGTATLRKMYKAIAKMLKDENLPALLDKSQGILALPEKVDD